MTSPTTTQAPLGYVAPFFIVRNVMPSIAFYKDRLGFEVTLFGPPDGPYFAMLKQDGVRLMLKAITPEVPIFYAGVDATIASPRKLRLRRTRHSQ